MNSSDYVRRKINSFSLPCSIILLIWLANFIGNISGTVLEYGCQLPSNIHEHSTDKSLLLDYLEGESSSLGTLQQSLLDRLKSKHKISIGSYRAGIVRETLKRNALKKQCKAVMSTETCEIDCRISLGKVPFGRTAIAPCQCLGSQKYVQFSTYNKLRRKFPDQWVLCRTCQSPYLPVVLNSEPDSTSDLSSAGLYLFSYLLDKRALLRTILGAIAIGLLHLVQFQRHFMQILVSKRLWNQYPQWSRIVHLPLVLRLWGARLAVQYFIQQYLSVETILMQYLADVETSLVEPRLKIVNNEETGGFVNEKSS